MAEAQSASSKHGGGAMAGGVDYKRYRQASTPATAPGIKSAATTEPHFLSKQRKCLLLQATLAASVTYESLAKHSPDWLCRVKGDALQVPPPGRCAVFFYFNIIALTASLVTIYLLSLHRRWLRTIQAVVILNQLSLLGAYVAGSCMEVGMSTYVVALVGMVCPYVLPFFLRRYSILDNLAAPETVELEPQRVVLLISILVTTGTYQAGLIAQCGLLSDIMDGDHVAGSPMVRGHHPDRRAMAFCNFNLTAFVASVTTTMLIISGTVTRTRLWLCACTGACAPLIVLTCAFAISGSMSVKAPINVLLAALVAAITLYMVVHTLSSAASNHRAHVTDDDQFLPESRKYLLLLAILAASVTYKAGLSRPDGFWQQNDAHRHSAGDTNLHFTNPPNPRYLVFFYCNATSFVASLLILVLLLNNTSLSTAIKSLALQVSMIVDLLGLVGAFAARNSTDMSESVYISAAVVLLVAVFPYVVIRPLVLRLQVFPNSATRQKIMTEKLKASVPSSSWPNKFFELPPKEDLDIKCKLEKSRNRVLLFAILVATLTYQAGMSPRGEFWQQNNTGHVAGNNLVLSNLDGRARGTAFFFCNAVGFVGSLALILVLLLNRKLSSRGILSHALKGFVILEKLIRQTGRFVTRIYRKVSICFFILVFVVVVYAPPPLHGILVVPEWFDIPGGQQILLFLFTIMDEEAGHISPPTSVDGPCPESEDPVVAEIGSEEDDVWVLDCSARMHYTSDVQLLDVTDESQSSLLDDDPAGPEILNTRGSVRSKWFEVPDVLYVEGYGRNVISVSQLARSHGLVTVFEPTCGYVSDPVTGQQVGRARLRDGVYVLEHLLVICQPQDVGSASQHVARVGTEELPGGVSELNLELPEKENWFGMSKRQRAVDHIVVDDFPMQSPYDEQKYRTRTKEFCMDSSLCHHMTWNGDVLRAYQDTLEIKPPIIGSGNILSDTKVNSEFCHPLNVEGIGYIDSKGGSLDRVLYVPGSIVNLVSVNQLTTDCSVRVVFHLDEFWIEKLQTKERIGLGKRVGNNYVLAVLDLGAATNWVLSSSALFHHTPNRNMLYDFQAMAGDVQSAGVDHLKILGHGLLVQTDRFKVPGIRYTAGGARNVISVVQLANDHGLVTIFEPGFCYVKDKGTGQIVGQGHLYDDLYVLKTLRINQEKDGRGSSVSHQKLGREDIYESQQQLGQDRKVHTDTMMGTLSDVQMTDREEWVLDTRASSHHTSNPQLLLGGRDPQETAMDMNGPSLKLRHGLVRTERFQVPDVRYIEGEAKNTISVAQLTDRHGLVVVFEPTRCYMMAKKTGQIVGQGHIRDDGVYVLDNLQIGQIEGEQEVDGGGKGGGQFRDGTDERIRNKAGGGRDEGKRPTQGEGRGRAGSAGGDRNGQSNGERSGYESGGGYGGGKDEGRGGQAGGGGDRDGDGDDGNNGGSRRGKEKKDGKDEEEQKEKEEEGEEKEEGEGEEKEEEDEGIKHEWQQESSNTGLLSTALDESICQCRRNAVRMILSGACHCEQCGRGPPGSTYSMYEDDPATWTFCTPRGGASSSPPSSEFYMDSGAAYHMTWNGDPDFLKTYPPDTHIQPPVPSINGIGGSECKVEGCGYIDNGKITLEGVLHVPTGKFNLVSLSKLVNDYSARVVFDRDLFSIQRLQPNEMIGQGYRNDDMHYVLDRFCPKCKFVETLPTTTFHAGGESASWPYARLARR